jgi:hypothetical protein
MNTVCQLDQRLNCAHPTTTWSVGVRTTLLLGLLPLLPLTGPAQGIPEPDLVMYGTITDRATGELVHAVDLVWHISDGIDSLPVPAHLTSIDGEPFFVARVPFESRQIGTQTLSPTPNTLELSDSPATYTRMALVNGIEASIVSSSRQTLESFTLSRADRGLIERVDLETGPRLVETFADWLARHGLPPDTDPGADPLGKGMTYGEQFIAGTDPNDPDSIFQFVDIVHEPQGLSLRWTSFPNRVYALERSEDLESGFASLQTGIPANVPDGAQTGLNTHLDTTATGPGPYFYRVRVDLPE